MGDLREEAAARRALHANHPTTRPFNDGSEETGLRGEEAFAREFGLIRDHFLRPGGDGGVDFRLSIDGKLCKVDVKGARKPVHLWVEVGHVNADIFVLAGVDDYLGDGLLGWAWKAEVLAAQPRNTPKGVMVHSIWSGRLHPIRELKARRR